MYIHKRLLSLSMLFLISHAGYTQGVGLGTDKPDSSAALDITATRKGLLIPRTSLTSILAITRPAKGLLAYDTVANQLMANTGSSATPNWQPVASNSNVGIANGWNIAGNRGINPVNQFIGNTDNQPLHFRVNNLAAGELNPVTRNIFWGLHAGQVSTVGISNIGIGAGALQIDSTDINLVAIGDSALFNNNKGSGNTAIGSKTLFTNTDGASNTAMGSNALFSNSTGGFNTAMGFGSLDSNTTGLSNSAIGVQSLFLNTGGSFNTAIGNQSLSNTTTGNNNTGCGYQSLFSNTTGNSNAASGYQALLSNTTGSSNLALGDSALFSNTIGSNNTAIGHLPLFSNANDLHDIGFNNTAIGNQALFSETVGDANIAIGGQALIHVKPSVGNLAIGNIALFALTGGEDNVALGTGAFGAVFSGFGGNTAVGAGAGSDQDLGAENTVVGSAAELFLDADGDVSLGAGARNTVDINQIFLGSSSVTSIGGHVNYSQISDGRFKRNIQENVKGIDFIMKLRPVTYQMDIPALSKKPDAGVHSGFIAQEVEKAAQDLGYDFNGVDKPRQEGGLYALRYATFTVPLVKTIQEQQRIIADLSQGNRALEDQLESLQKKAADRKKLNVELQQRIAMLESSMDTTH